MDGARADGVAGGRADEVAGCGHDQARGAGTPKRGARSMIFGRFPDHLKSDSHDFRTIGFMKMKAIFTHPAQTVAT